MNTESFKLLAATLVALAFGRFAEAGVYSLNPNSFDTVVGISFSIGGGPDLTGYYVNDPDPRVGSVLHSSGTLLRQVKIYGFELPVLDYSTIASAQIHLVSATLENSGPAFNLDLYGLNTTNPDGSGISLFFQGENDPSQQELADDYVIGGGFGPTPGPHVADVTAFIRSLYAGMSPSQSEVFFRLNPNQAFLVSPPDVNQFISADFLANGFLVIETIPEPATVILLFLGFASLCTAARRHQRTSSKMKMQRMQLPRR